MNRRTLLKGGGAAFVGLVALGAISKETTYLGDPDAGQAKASTTDGSEPEPEPTRTTETIYDAEAWTDETTTFEASAGDSFTVDIENVRGRYAYVRLYSYNGGTKYIAGTDDAKKDGMVQTSKTITVGLEEDDVYYFDVIPDDRARATAEVTRYD